MYLSDSGHHYSQLVSHLVRILVIIVVLIVFVVPAVAHSGNTSASADSGVVTRVMHCNNAVSTSRKPICRLQLG